MMNSRSESIFDLNSKNHESDLKNKTKLSPLRIKKRDTSSVKGSRNGHGHSNTITSRNVDRLISKAPNQALSKTPSFIRNKQVDQEF